MDSEIIHVCQKCKLAVVCGNVLECPKCGNSTVEQEILYEWVSPVSLKKIHYCPGMNLRGRTKRYDVWTRKEVETLFNVTVRKAEVGHNGRVASLVVEWEYVNSLSGERRSYSQTLTPRQFRRKLKEQVQEVRVAR